MDNERLSANFSRHEFACQCGCGADNISPDLVERLQKVRDLLGSPMKITSGVRCEKHNASPSVGGSKTSAHLPDDFGIGHAVDIACSTSNYRAKLLACAFGEFTRIGVAKTFIHLDSHPGKSQMVCWVY